MRVGRNTVGEKIDQTKVGRMETASVLDMFERDVSCCLTSYQFLSLGRSR